MGVTEIAKKYGVTRQAVYARIKADEEKRKSTAVSAYGMDVVQGIGSGNHDYHLIDPATGLAVRANGNAAAIMNRMGDEKVTAFVEYHMEMLRMRQGVDKKDVTDLYRRFADYLDYCARMGIIPNNMNCYFALGITRQDVHYWKSCTDIEHKEFAETLSQFFASVHEQAATDGIVNPIYSMWLQKAHDNMIEAQKLEVVQDDPLGSRRSAEDIAAKYTDLPD